MILHRLLNRNIQKTRKIMDFILFQIYQAIYDIYLGICNEDNNGTQYLPNTYSSYELSNINHF